MTQSARRNHLAIVAERAFGSPAYALLTPDILLTALVVRLGGGEMTVGALRSLTVVAGLAQLFTAWRLDRPASRRRYVLAARGASLLVLLVLALVLWTWAETRPTLALALLIGLMFLRWATGAMCNPALLDLSRQLVAQEERTRVFSIRQFAAAATGLGAGALAAVLLDRVGFPASYVAVALVAAVALAAAWLSVAAMQETGPAGAADATPGLREFAGKLVHLLRPGSGGEEERRFRSYVAVRHAIFLSRCAFPFATLYGLRRFGIGEHTVGHFLIAVGAGRLASGLALSLLPGLRATPRRITRLALSGTVIGLAVAVLAPHWEWLLVTFFLQGAFLEAFLVADSIFMMEHAPSGREVLGMSLTMVSLYPMTSVLPILAGVLFAQAGFAALAFIAIGGAGLAFVAVGRLAPPAGDEESGAADVWEAHD